MLVRNSQLPDSWLQEMMRLNPPQREVGKDGKPTGNILTGPVRLTFLSLLQPQKVMKTSENSRIGYYTTCLFPPGTDMAIFWEEYYRICNEDFGNMRDPQSGQFMVDNPFSMQDTKLQYGGYTPGAYFLPVFSQFKPPVVHASNPSIPVQDQARIYPGVWAIVAVNGYASGKGKPRKGPRFGLQAVMLIADDTPLTGGSVDPTAVFSSVSVKPPSMPLGFAPGQVPPPPGQGGFVPPPGAPAQTYYPPNQGHTPGAPPPGYGAPPPPPPAPPQFNATQAQNGQFYVDLSRFA